MGMRLCQGRRRRRPQLPNKSIKNTSRRKHNNNPPNHNTPQIFPYHLAAYVCRVQRATPFRYYRELLFQRLRDERPYDSVPNFAVSLCREDGDGNRVAEDGRGRWGYE